MPFEAAATTGREEALMAAESLAVRLMTATAAKILAAYPGRFTFYIDTAKNQNPASRVNQVFLYIEEGSGPTQKILKIKVDLDHTLDNPETYQNGASLFMSSYYVMQNGSTPHGGMHAWFGVNADTLAGSIVANHRGFF